MVVKTNLFKILEINLPLVDGVGSGRGREGSGGGGRGDVVAERIESVMPLQSEKN